MTLKQLLARLQKLEAVHGDCDVCVLQGEGEPEPCIVAGVEADVTCPTNVSKFPVIMLYTEEDLDGFAGDDHRAWRP